MSPRPDGSRTSVRVQICGQLFDLHQTDVSRIVARLEPAEIRDHFVEIRGRRYPVKQALGAATGLDLSDFTSQHARSALRRLGFHVGRLSSARATAPRRPYGSPDYPGQTSTVGSPTDPAVLAAVLRDYRNRWVAVQRNQVLTDQDSFSEVVAWLRSNDVKADGVFLVPSDPARLLAGLAN